MLLAGDAAGVDPLLGEGISFALALGRVAAAAVSDAFARDDLSFAGYSERLLSDPLLAQRRRLVRRLYVLRGRRRLAALWQAMPCLLLALLRFRPGMFPVTSPRLDRLSELAPEELRIGS